MKGQELDSLTIPDRVRRLNRGKRAVLIIFISIEIALSVIFFTDYYLTKNIDGPEECQMHLRKPLLLESKIF